MDETPHQEHKGVRYRRSEPDVNKGPWSPAWLTALGRDRSVGGGGARLWRFDRSAVAVVGMPKRPARIRKLVRTGLKAHGVEVLDFEDERWALGGRRPVDAQPRLARGSAALDRAEGHLAMLRIEKAARDLALANRAIDAIAGRPEAKALDLRRLVTTVSVAHARRDFAWQERALAALAYRHGRDVDVPSWSPDLQDKLRTVVLGDLHGVQVETEPLEADVFVGGRLRCRRSPCELEMPSGEHHLMVEAPRYLRRDLSVEVAGPQAVRLELQLDLGPRLAQVSALETLPEKLVDDVRTWAQGLELTSVVFAEARGASLRLRRLDVRKGLGGIVELVNEPSEAAVARLDAVAPSTRAEAWTPVAWGVGATGVAALGVGIALRLVAVGTQNDVRSRRDSLSQVEAFRLQDRAESEALAGGIMIGVGAAAVVGSLALGWWAEGAPWPL